MVRFDDWENEVGFEAVDIRELARLVKRYEAKKGPIYDEPVDLYSTSDGAGSVFGTVRCTSCGVEFRIGRGAGRGMFHRTADGQYIPIDTACHKCRRRGA